MVETGEAQDDNERSTADPNSEFSCSRCESYEIHVKGQLSSQWSEWLEGLEVILLDNGEMVLFGPIVDQAALLGILNKLTHINLTLLSVNKVIRKNNKETK